MAKKTFFVVQPFEKAKGRRLKAGIPMEVRDAEEASRKAERMSLIKAGAVAFSTEVEMESGDAEPPVLIATYGEVPDGGLELAF
ncbi:hypothetical protein [Ancylobacter sp.]|uniref:hypothetical protein n=1 Tax=Ancylobacter sp. TaxID=1872567 RepID=UPI003D0D6D64